MSEQDAVTRTVKVWSLSNTTEAAKFMEADILWGLFSLSDRLSFPDAKQYEVTITVKRIEE